MRILLLLLFITLFSCSKDSDKTGCWECDINTPSGSGPAPGKVEICNGSDTKPTQWTDANGNTYGGFQCVKK